MLRIYCPHCKEFREEEEFFCDGEALVARPSDPDALGDAEWASYLFMRDNPKGKYLEQWSHALGCRKYLVLEKDTSSGQILASMTLEQARKFKNGD